MLQPAVREVYAFIESWWGEGLTAELVQKIYNAPRSHLLAFSDEWPDLSSLYRSGHLSQTEPGEIRPIFGRLGASTELETAAGLLLYVDATIVDANFLEPLRLLDRRAESVETRRAIRDLFDWLRLTRPLAEDGALLYTGKHRGRHPSVNWRLVRSPLRESALADWADSEFRGMEPSEVAQRVYELGNDLSGNIAVASEGTGNVLALTRAEEVAYRLTLGGVAIGDRRKTHLETLARFKVPVPEGRLETISILRRDSENFDRWRTMLRNAMEVIAEVPEGSKAIDQARQNLDFELRRALHGVEREISRSPALRSLIQGARGLAFAGVGTAVGVASASLLGNPVLGALAGGASALGSRASEVMVDHFQKRRADRAGKALLDVALSFRPTTEDDETWQFGR